MEENLDKKRDDKCFPVMRGVLSDMVTDLIPENANEKIDYNPIVKKILQRELDADLNLTTEVPYIFQGLLGVFAGLNITVQGCEMIPADDVRYGAIAKKVLGIVDDANVSLGDPSKEQIEKDFEPAKARLNALFAEEKLTAFEVKYIMDNIFDALKTVEGIIAAQIEDSASRAEAKLFGIDSKVDLTMKILDDVLKAEVPSKVEETV